MILRQHYWNPRDAGLPFVSETQFIYAFNKKQDSGTWSDLHVHPEWGELVYVASGSIVLCTGTGNFLGHANRAVWVPPGLQHEWYMPESSINRTLFIHTSAFSETQRFMKYHAVVMTPLLRELILAMGEQRTDLTHPESLRLGLVLLDQLRATHADGTPLLMPCEHRLVELCVEAMTAVDQPVRLSDWSRRLNISEKTLARLFVRQTGQTFGRWLQSMRLQHAMAELNEGCNVTTVALNCGYNSVSAFISSFKKHFGTTPGTVNKRSSSESQDAPHI